MSRRQASAALIALALFSAPPVAGALEPTPEMVAPAARDVTPPGVTPGPPADGPLMREPTPPRPPEPARWRRFFLPKTIDSATFRVNERAIRISGVTAPAPDRTCRRADGTEWPCGQTALHALRMFLRGRAIECYFPQVEAAVDVTAPCRVGKTDLGQWLLSQGWVMPDELATEDYRKAADTARCARRGLWRWSETAPSSCPAGAADQGASSPASALAIRARVSGMP